MSNTEGSDGRDMGNGVRKATTLDPVVVVEEQERNVTCTFSGQCPKCLVPLGQLGEHDSFPLHTQRSVIGTYLLVDKDVHKFHWTCCEAGLKPVIHPFWAIFPLADIFISITPDILHQMLQGVMKHLIGWVISIFGPLAIDARCKSMPPNHKILLFTKGITTLSRISGHEHKKMCSILLGLIIDLQSLVVWIHCMWSRRYTHSRTSSFWLSLSAIQVAPFLS